MLLELLFVAAGCAAPETPEVVGLWESLRKSKGGIGHAIELRPDGTYMEGNVVMLDLRYRVAAGQMTWMDANGPSEKVVRTSSLRIKEPTLVERNADGQEVTKVRVGSASTAREAIVGEWSYTHPAGGTADERYTEDGGVFFRLPLASDGHGCYTVQGSTVSLANPRGVVKLTLHEGQFQAVGEPALSYARASGGSWYPMWADHH